MLVLFGEVFCQMCTTSKLNVFERVRSRRRESLVSHGRAFVISRAREGTRVSCLSHLLNETRMCILSRMREETRVSLLSRAYF